MRIRFHDKALETFFITGTHKGISPSLACRVAKCLQHVSKAKSVKDIPNTHTLRRGDATGSVAVKVSGAWRLVFRVVEGSASEMVLCQYH